MFIRFNCGNFCPCKCYQITTWPGLKYITKRIIDNSFVELSACGGFCDITVLLCLLVTFRGLSLIPALCLSGEGMLKSWLISHNRIFRKLTILWIGLVLIWAVDAWELLPPNAYWQQWVSFWNSLHEYLALTSNTPFKWKLEHGEAGDTDRCDVRKSCSSRLCLKWF